jgi:alkanesulfonate monooxygenase SsuD/methylene tetrahydromethanopterin reductase-like flavin-dependent oxidoreductase (luciferase family)
MEAEFRAVGVPLRRRGAITDATLDFLERAFAADEVEENGQRFLFLPRPPRPPIFVGGSTPHALRRAASFGEGWMPTSGDPEALAPMIAELRRMRSELGRTPPEVVTLTSLPLDDPARAADQVAALGRAGVTRIVHAFRYADPAELARAAETLLRTVRR